jgi:glycerol 2-dehydrogenase (NADP+)
MSPDQVEISIQCPQPELVEYCKKNDILVCAYSPLGGTAGTYLREHKVVTSIAEKYDVHGATILLSWLIKRGICPLPKSVTASRIAANLKTVDLTEQEFEEIEKLAESHPPKRVCDQAGSYEPYYDIFQESDPELSDKAQWAKELKA